MKKIVFNFITLVFLITLFELILFGLNKTRTSSIVFKTEKISKFSFRDIKKCSNKKICYDVLYELDEYGHRSVKQKKAKKHLLIFGDSISFGKGIDNRLTYSSILNQSSSLQVYNFSRSGTGPNYALHLIESEEFKNKVFQPEGIGFFLLFNFHLDRMSFNPKNAWAARLPAYQFKNGKLVKYNQQVEQVKKYKWIYSIFGFLQKHSHIFKTLDFKLKPTSKKEDLATIAHVLKKIQIEYEKKFDGKFIVLGAPWAKPGQDIIGELNKLKVNYHQLNSKKFKYEPLCDCDRHPNINNQKELAFIIQDFLNTVK